MWLKMKIILFLIAVPVLFFLLFNGISVSLAENSGFSVQPVSHSTTWVGSPLTAKQTQTMQFTMEKNLLESDISTSLSTSNLTELPVIVMLKRQDTHATAIDVKRIYNTEIEEKRMQLSLATNNIIRKNNLQSALWNYKENLNDNEKLEIEMLSQQLDSKIDEGKRELYNRLDRITASERNTVRAAIENCGGKITGETVIINALFARIPKPCLQILTAQKEIFGIYENRKMQIKLDVSNPTTGADTWGNNGYNGSAIDVAIVDTGINNTHPALSVSASKVFHDDGYYDFFYWDDNTTADDFHGHGTHVAGIVASKDSTYKGIAPGVNLINAKAGWLDWFGSAGMYSSDAMKAIDWAINASGADVISYSFGGGTCTGDTPMGRFMDAVVDDLNVFVDVAAGNDGPDECTVGSPASSFNVMSVANVDDRGTADRGDDIINESSSRGYTFDWRIKPDIAVPGTNIMSANTFWDGTEPDFIEMTGTSIAAPHVGGAAALLLDYSQMDPIAVKAILVNSANNTGEFSNQTNYGWGYMNMQRAYTKKDYVTSGMLYDADSASLKLARLYKSNMSTGDKASLVWNRHVVSNGTDYPKVYYTLNDIDLFLINEDNNELLNYSISGSNNIEQVVSNNTYENAVIEVASYYINFTHNSDSENYALAADNNLIEVFGPNATITNYSMPSSAPLNSLFVVTMTINNTGDLTAHEVYANISLESGLVNVSGPIYQYIGKLAPGGSQTVNWAINTTAIGVSNVNLSVKSLGYGFKFLSDVSTSINVTDSLPPQWSNNMTSFASPLSYQPGGAYQFNMTWEDDVALDKVFFNLDGKWKPVSNSGSEYYYTAYDLGAGLHNYSWFANDTSGNSNITEVLFFEINKSIPIIKLELNSINGNNSIDYKNILNVTGTLITGDATATLTLFRNGTQVSNPDTNEPPVGTYVYNFTYGESENYTAAWASHVLMINKIAPTLRLFLNDVDSDNSVAFGTSINVTGALVSGDSGVTVKLLRNGTEINNPDNDALSKGTYNYTLIYAETQNYTGGKITHILTISAASNTVSLYLNGLLNSNATQTYGTDSNATATSLYGTVQLYQNGVAVSNPDIRTLGGGLHRYTANVSATENYTGASQEFYLTIDPVTTVVTLYLNDNGGNAVITYGAQSNATATTNIGTVNMYRDGSAVNNPEIATLGAGSYVYVANVTGNANYTSATQSFTLSINKAPVDVRLFLNGVEGNNTIEVGTPINVTGIVMGGQDVNLTLYRNGFLVNNPDTTNLTAGTYQYNLTCESTQNYTCSILLRTLTVLPPILEYSIQQDNSTYAQNKNYTFNATWISSAGISDIILEFDGTNYSLSSVEIIKNNNIYTRTFVDLAAGNYSYKWYANDTKGNWNWTQTLIFVVEKAIPSILEITPADSVTTGTPTTVRCYTNVTGITPQLYRDGIKVLFNIEENNLVAGSYTYFCNNTATQNYTSSDISKILTVSSPSSAAPATGSGGTGESGGPVITSKPVVPIPSTPKPSVRAQAELELGRMQSLLENAKMENKNVSAAQSKLTDAQNAFVAGDYRRALALLDEVSTLIKNAPETISPSPGIISGLTGAVIGFVGNPMALAASAGLVASGFIYWIFRSGKFKLPKFNLPKKEEFKSEEQEFEDTKKKGRKYF